MQNHLCETTFLLVSCADHIVRTFLRGHLGRLPVTVGTASRKCKQCNRSYLLKLRQKYSACLFAYASNLMLWHVWDLSWESFFLISRHSISVFVTLWPLRVCTRLCWSVFFFSGCVSAPLSSRTWGAVCDEHAEAYANTYNNQLLPNSLPSGAETCNLLLVTLPMTKNVIETDFCCLWQSYFILKGEADLSWKLLVCLCAPCLLMVL